MRSAYPDYKKVVFAYARLLGMCTLGVIVVVGVSAAYDAPDWVVLLALGVVLTVTCARTLLMVRVWAREQRQAASSYEAHRREPQAVSRRPSVHLLASFVGVLAFLGLLALVAGLLAHIAALAVAGSILFASFLIITTIVAPLLRSRRATKR